LLPSAIISSMVKMQVRYRLAHVEHHLLVAIRPDGFPDRVHAFSRLLATVGLSLGNSITSGRWSRGTDFTFFGKRSRT
jgi:hypothetical protein